MDYAMLFGRNKKNQQKLSVKIGIGFGLVALVLIGTITFTLIKINQTDKINQRLYLQITPQMAQAMRIISGLHVLMSNERDWLISKESKYKLQRDVAWKQKIIPSISALQNVKDERTEARIKQIHDNLDVLYRTINDTSKIDTTNSEKEVENFYNNIYPIATETENILTNFIHERESVLFAGLQNARKQIIHILFVDAAFLLIGLILCILLGIVLTNLVTKPIRNLMQMTNEIAKGDLEQNINLSEAYEFEQLSHSINHVVKTLKTIADVNTKMSEGDYNHQVKIKSKNDKLAISTNKMLDNFNAIVKQANAIVNGDYTSEMKPRSAHDELGIALQNMTEALRNNKHRNDEQNWLKDGLAQFANAISDARDINKLCNDSLSVICRHISAGMGAIYLLNRENKLLLHGTFAVSENNGLDNQYEIGQGLIGQVAYEQKAIQLDDIPNSSQEVDTGLVKQASKSIYAFPLIYEKKLIGVCEVVWITAVNQLVYQYLDSLTPILSSHIQATQQQILTEELLHEQESLAEKLSTQQEELKATNEELELQTQILKASEEELRIKDEEQQKINNELEQRTKELELQKSRMQEANTALASAKSELETKADELSQASKYKSEFLANMSHELRTPLNSLLILAKLFANNSENNLTEEQVESAKIMLKSGQDLLMLINDILDLAKVESGKIEMYFSTMNLHEMIQYLNATFSVIAKDKNITFKTEILENVPKELVTDEQRVTQIIRNLLSNAMKFTDEGGVKLKIYLPHRENELLNANFNLKNYLAIAVSDTGIGISSDKQASVFEFFQQEDGTTSRKYGGTGLGLSISKQFTKLLNGHLRLESEKGKGSTFILYLPLNQAADDEEPINETPDGNITEIQSEKKALNLVKSNSLKKILIVEDDKTLANVFIKVCHDNEYMCRHVTTTEDASNLLDNNLPDAIMLNLNMIENGLPKLLFKIKNSETIAKLSLQFILSGSLRTDEIKTGLIGYLVNLSKINQILKVINQNNQAQKILVFSHDQSLAIKIGGQIENKPASIDTVNNVADLNNFFKKINYNLIILHFKKNETLPLDEIANHFLANTTTSPAIILYFDAADITNDPSHISSLCDSLIIKGKETAKKPIEKTTMRFIKNINAKKEDIDLLEENKKVVTANKHQTLTDKKILLVDDDARNIFAIKKILTMITPHIITATDGHKALKIAKSAHDIDLILMDIMMPIMDGGETAKAIRQLEQYKHTPIVALSAKVLAEDKEKYLSADMNDYITKPINMDLLIKKVKKWLVTKV